MHKLSLFIAKISGRFRKEGRLATRFRNINFIMFFFATAVVMLVVFLVLHNITDTVSQSSAGLYASNTISVLNTFFEREIALISKAARSNAVVNWFADEDNPEHKSLAYDEMTAIIDVLSSNHLYFGIEKTLNEYSLEEGYSLDQVAPFANLDPYYFDDAWYFECTASEYDYLLNVDIDKVFKRKLVWLNHKVMRDGEVYGVLCTGLEFSTLVEKIFAEFDNKSIRGMVVNENGVIEMDSEIQEEDGGHLYYSSKGEGKHAVIEIGDSHFTAAMEEYLRKNNGYFTPESETVVVQLSGGTHDFATIAPIASTTWSVVTLYSAASLFNMKSFLPLIIFIPLIFVVFIWMTNFSITKLIFKPFGKMMDSIAHTKVNINENIYGTDRGDEIGDLANAVQSMKDILIDALSKVHYDPLTGIYNRRFLDENLGRILRSLSRYGGLLSVIMLDIDYFKLYNDTYGHGAGDSCLKQIAIALMNSTLRSDDFVARYGGEEFVIVLPNTDSKGAKKVASRVAANVKNCRIVHEAGKTGDLVTMSIGATTGRVSHSQTAEDYINRADEALYVSKDNGRNSFTFMEMEDAAISEETVV